MLRRVRVAALSEHILGIQNWVEIGNFLLRTEIDQVSRNRTGEQPVPGGLPPPHPQLPLLRGPEDGVWGVVQGVQPLFSMWPFLCSLAS